MTDKGENIKPIPDKNLSMIEILDGIKALPEGEHIEITLPPEFSHLAFIGELGREANQVEYGGLFNIKTRSMVIQKGFLGQGFENPRVAFMPPRRNEDNTTDDIFFHTHPFEPKTLVGYLRDPKNSCLPSGTDNNNMMAVKMIEEEAGSNSAVISIISSGGYISVTEAKGTRFDEYKLAEIGVSQDEVTRLKNKLALEPPRYFLNYVEDVKSKEAVWELMLEFYQKKSDGTTKWKDLISWFREEVEQYTGTQMIRGVPVKEVDRLTERLISHLPEEPNLSGLSLEQAQKVREMMGVDTRIMKAEDISAQEFG